MLIRMLVTCHVRHSYFKQRNLYYSSFIIIRFPKCHFNNILAITCILLRILLTINKDITKLDFLIRVLATYILHNLNMTFNQILSMYTYTVSLLKFFTAYTAVRNRNNDQQSCTASHLQCSVSSLLHSKKIHKIMKFYARYVTESYK